MEERDRVVLKAETEDGYGRVANLLLEALSISKLNGKQMSICLFIIRRTYSWSKKADEITLKEFAAACDSSETYMSKQLKQLIEWKVIKRNNYSPGKVPDYEINTRVDEWDKGCLNVQGLNENTRQGLYNTTRVDLNKRTRVVQGQSIETTGIEAPLKESIKESIKKDTITTMTDEEIKFEKENLVTRVDADSTKQDTSLSSLESYYLHEVRKQTMCSSKDMLDMVHVYETYKDIDFILSVLQSATKENIKRNGKCKINSFSYFIPILEDRWEEMTKPKEVEKVESIRANSKKSSRYDLSEFLWTGEN